MVTEMDKLQRAKEYLLQLAEGKDPFTGEELEGDTVLNNVRLSRCFFYVADVLRQVMANGGKVKASAGQTAFYIADEELARVSISDTPVPVSTVVKAVNEATGEPPRKKLSVMSVTNWLMMEGYLKSVEAQEGSHKRVLTDKSASIGMSSELREGARGKYEIMLYDKNAQRFLLDNLKHIIKGY